MFPYPLHSLDEVSRTPNIRLLENIDSLVDPYLSDLVFTVNDSQLNVKVSILDGVQFSPIEGSGLPLPDNDLQAAKWGKAAKLTGATDMLKGMEIDDQPELIPISDDFTIMSECEKGSDVPLTASYARIMSRACKQVVSNPVLSMDDVVVESGDVTMDMTGGLSSESPMIPVATAGDCGASDGVVMREVNANIQESVQVISSRGAQLHKLFLMRKPITWKSSGSGLKSGLKVGMGKENKTPARPILTNWLPTGSDHVGAASMGACATAGDFVQVNVAALDARTMNASASDLGRVCNEALVTTTLVTTVSNAGGSQMYHPHLVMLLEPCISGVSADRVLGCLGFSNSFWVETSGLSGGIWLIWNDGIDVDIIEGWASCFPASLVSHLDWVGSDHCLLLFYYPRQNGDREGRPFHFIATWQDHPQFEDFLRNTWDMTVDVESNVSLFAEEARHWNDTMFKIIGPKKRELLARIRGMGRALSKNHSNFLVQLDIDLRAELDEGISSVWPSVRDSLFGPWEMGDP
ncbi:hypothetical protein V6N12_074794 [Hibiscus sabdariffa]|uniref:Uncharacterized protein n=1 Tax=Hibiscus sabdariffa TaxID=183260 RepID=A0ABR2D2F2_9ROSI